MRIWIWIAVLLACAGCKKSDTTPRAGSGSDSSESAPASAKGAGEAVMLKVKWPVGNRYVQRMEVNGDTETRLPQMPKPMMQKVNLNQEYSVTVVADRELELEFDSTEMDVTMNGKSVVSMDSKAEAGAAEANPTVAGFRQIVGAKIKFLLDQSNRVEKMEGAKEFLAKASGSSNPQARAAMQGTFNDEYFKQMVDFQRGLPPNPVKSGDSWPVKTELAVPVLGQLNLDMNYTLAGWEQREKRTCAAIDFVGTMTSKGDAGQGGGPPGMSMRIESGKMTGKTWFDPELGHPVETLVNQDMVLHMSMPKPANAKGGNQPGAGQTITNNVKQKIVIKLVEVASAGK